MGQTFLTGELRHVVTVERRSTVRGTGGELGVTWVTVTTLRCRIWPGKGKEIEEARREVSKVSVRFFARYVSGIDTGMRLKFGARYFDIVAVVNIGELGREMEITAVETA